MKTAYQEKKMMAMLIANGPAGSVRIVTGLSPAGRTARAVRHHRASAEGTIWE